jgi:hypothetical protein
MNKTLIFILVAFLRINSLSAQQETVKINLAKQITASASNTIKLYKFNPNNPCEQSKAVSIIYENKVASCFDYVKTIAVGDVKKTVSLLRTPTTYGSEDVACFDTDYALLIFDKKNVVIGYVNISLSCNKLISNPIITERGYYSKGGLQKVGFSKKGRSNLLKLLAITDYKK